MSGYDVMQVCRRGHEITPFARTHPERQAAFCDKCGSPTILQCDRCQAHIRGYYRTDRGGYSPEKPPAFCHGCGKPYPWTEEQLTAAKDFVAELDDLDAREQQQLGESLEAIMHDTASTNLGVVRIKKFITKIKGPLGEALYKVAMDLATDTAAKMLKGS